MDVAADRVLRVRGAPSWWRRRRARRRLAADDAPAAAVVPVAVEGLPAKCTGPLDERRQCGQHDAGECPALLGFGERDSAGLLFGDRGPERAVVMAALGGGPRLLVGALVQDPQGGPCRGIAHENANHGNQPRRRSAAAGSADPRPPQRGGDPDRSWRRSA